MKELSIEEKAKAYDEAVERAKLELNSPDKRLIEYIFPGLKESMDEKIRKDIISLVDEFWAKIGSINPEFTTHDKMIAWLEKQGEQRPAGEVEPKFYEGDWVILTAGELSTTLQIVKIDTNKKLYWFNDGSYLPIVDEECLHLWTIQDAKDGDVLAVEPIEENYQYSFVAIFKERGLDFFNSYCFIGFDGKFYKGENGHSTEKVHPATKEQRDTLLKAMADEGYTFDFEKKELKKIEQKPAWSKEDETGLGDALWAIQQARTIAKDENDMGNLWYAGTWLQSLKDRVVLQPKQEWNDEDDSNTSELCSLITESYSKETASELRQWIKSLKDRVQPQPKQEWSEEDEHRIKDTVYFLETAKKHYASTVELDACIDWIKSLRPQSTWKPSDEQLDALQYVYRNCNPPISDKLGWNSIRTLELMYQELNKLREEDV